MPFSNTSISSGPYSANGVTVRFPFVFKLLSDTEIEVVVLDADGVVATLAGWHLENVTEVGGDIVFTTAPSYLTSGQALYVRAKPTFAQTTNFENQGAYNPAEINKALDRAFQLSAWLRDRVGSGGSSGGGGSGGSTPAWIDILDKPSTFPPSAHTHAQADITGLVAALGDKANISHTHSTSDINSGVFDVARIPGMDASKITTGVFDAARLPSTGTNTVVSSGDITALTTPQQAAIVEGTTVYLSTGLRYVYTGTGSKTSLGSYVAVPDAAPDWSTIGSKPANVTALAGLTGAADKVPYFTGAGVMAVADFTTTGRALAAAASAAAGLALLTPLTTKGDLMARSASVTTRLAVGTDGYALVASSAAATGLAWAPQIGLDLSTTTLQPAASAEVHSAAQALNRQHTLLKWIPTGLHAAILNHTSNTNIATYLQEALDYLDSVGGGELLVEPGLYRVATAIYIPSKVKLRGMGARSVIKSTDDWASSGVMAGTGYAHVMMANKNVFATELTDEDIILEDITLDHNGLFYGDGHLWLMRYVRRPQRRFARFLNGGSACPTLACLDSLTLGCYAYNMGASFYDHWDGFGFAKVIGCVGRNPAGRGIQQGIQFTGTSGEYTSRNSAVSLSMGNQLYKVRGIGYGPGNQAAAIIANGVSSGSTNNCFKSIGDYVEDADVGLVFSGNGGGHEVHDLTLKNVTTVPVLIQDEGSGAVPSNCVIDGLHMIGCSYVGSPAMVNIGGGTNHTIKGLKFSGCTYAVQLWLNAGANYNYIYPIDGPNGTSANISDSGTGNQLYSFSGGGGSYLPLGGGTLSGPLVVGGTLTCGVGGLINLTSRQPYPGFFTGGESTDSLGTRFNALVIALGNLGLIG